MLIRCKGYNTGAKEYLEEGKKEGREFSRNELDERVILDGDLDLTQMVYESIPDNGQNRYLSFTMAFREDAVSHETLAAVTAEFKQFMMCAYKDDEFNFYAEAHLPKIKTIRDKKTGEMIERKPHIHIIIPRKNLLNGNEANPVGIYSTNERYFEAFQEYINQKYNLASPREHVRVDPKDAASVLSRYKGDDFYGKNREFKQALVKQIIETGVSTRQGFYDLVATHGEIKIRNQGKENEYVAVKLPDDAKFTNLKDTIFQDDFVVRRQLKKPPLEKRVIQERLSEWPERAKELKYVSKATPSFRKLYKDASPTERTALLSQREQAFYANYGDSHVVKPRSTKRKNRGKRSAIEAGTQLAAEAAPGLQDLSISDVAIDRQAGPTQKLGSSQLLHGDAYFHLGQQDAGGNIGLRPPLREGGRPGRTATGRSGRHAGLPTSAAARYSRDATAGASRQLRIRERGAGDVIPPYALNPRRRATISDIELRGQRLFDPFKQLIDSALVVDLAVAIDSVHLASRDPPQAKSKRRKDKARTIPPYARNPRSRASISDIEQRGRRLFHPLDLSYESALEIGLVDSADHETSRDPPEVDPGSGQPAKQRKTRSNPRTKRNIPPYALNPHRAATIADIESRTQRLFAHLKVSADSSLLMKLATIKPMAVNRNASTVAAYFNRQIEKGRLLPAQRKAVQRVNKQFFEIRRSVFSDERLSKQDKAQLVSVLTFERMKAHEAIQKPHIYKEATYMGSAEIRGLVNDQPQEELQEFSISGPGPSAPPRDRVQALIARLRLQTNDQVSKEREKELSAKDIYTKKSRFSQNVHYLSKTTDKTIFVDTGTAIAMRRTGITEAGVGVALQLATQRFGSTLTINGSAEFKRLVVEAAAKNGMDIHFTDKKMNEALTLRRDELDIGKEAEKIQSPAAAAAETDTQTQEVITTSETASPVVVDRSIIIGELVAHGPDSYQGDPNNGPSYYVELKTEAGPKKLWGVALEDAMAQHEFTLGDRIKLKDLGREAITIQKTQPDGSTKNIPGFRRAWSAEPEGATQDKAAVAVPAAPAAVAQAAQSLGTDSLAVPAQTAVEAAVSTHGSPSELVRREQAWRDKFPLTEEAVLTEAEVLSSDVMMGLRGEDHAMWLVATNDHTKEGVAMITAYMENDEYRDRFKNTLEDLYDQHQDSPEIIKSLDEATGFVVPIVRDIERSLMDASVAAKHPQPQSSPAPLNFTHNGEAASLGLKPLTESTEPLAEPAAAAPMVVSPAAPLNFTHEGQAATLRLPPIPTQAVPSAEDVQPERAAAPEPLNFVHQGQPASLGLNTEAQSTSEYECPDESPAMAQTLRDPYDPSQRIELGDLLNRVDQQIDSIRSEDDPHGEVKLMNDLISRVADPLEKQLLTSALVERYIGEEEHGPDMD
ncbi:relaxase, NikB family (plasmid) [Pseudomonas fluorescens A506]|nr:relaxase, NikB family [Pseudomonas fluorescens A506]